MEVVKRKGQSSLLTIGGITKSTAQWAEDTGIDSATISRRIRNGWSEEEIFKEIIPAQRYDFNEHYFDTIDNEHKAYWLGFIWADGYMAIRHRNNRTSYEFKLSLKYDDWEHLVKFNSDLNGKYKVKFYEQQTSFGEYKEARLLITNQHFGKTLSDKYGIIPHRSDCSKIIEAIPEFLMKHFIRGLIDADGSFCKYNIVERGYDVNKYRVSIGTNEELLRIIEKHLMYNNIINISERKLYQRHQGHDGEYKTLEISGKEQCLSLLNYIYNDANIYLNRKYKKYLDIYGI